VPSMMIIGWDFHPRSQQIAYLDLATGECGERHLGDERDDQRWFPHVHLRCRRASLRGEKLCCRRHDRQLTCPAFLIQR